jgi:hypothetical protein
MTDRMTDDLWGIVIQTERNSAAEALTVKPCIKCGTRFYLDAAILTVRARREIIGYICKGCLDISAASRFIGVCERFRMEASGRHRTMTDSITRMVVPNRLPVYVCVACGSRREYNPAEGPRERCPWCAQVHYMVTRFGYRPSRSRYLPCPRQVMGLRCHRYRALDPSCPCLRHQALLDHARLWVTPDGRHAITGEPYGVRPGCIERLTAEMRTLGLEVVVEPYSPYCPGSTVLIHLRPAERGE